MKPYGIAVTAAALIAASGCELIGGPQVTGSGKQKTEHRSVGKFDSIESKGPFQVTVQVGSASSVDVSADDNVVPLIRTAIQGGKLVLDSKGSFNTKGPIKIVIHTPSLTGLELSGSGSIDAVNVKASDIALSVSGSGEVKVAGSASKVDASVSGSGVIDSTKLSAQSVNVSIAGSGGVDCLANGDLQVNIAGSGAVTYRGNPKVSKSITGSGSVSKST